MKTHGHDFKNVTDLSDRQLLFYARKYGTQALLWRQKFIGLLPEVHKRRLYEKKGFSSIFEFGKRMAGLSEAQIRLTLNLEKRFIDKPHLHAALVGGKVSINKLTRVASIANSENDSFLAETAKSLSNRSLEVLVKGIKCINQENEEKTDELKMQNGFPLPQNECKSLHVQKFQLDEKVVEKLNELAGRGLDVNDILLELLEKRESEIKIRKQAEGERQASKTTNSRYISVKSKQILHQEFGTKCAVPNCKKPKQHIHHVLPHSLIQSNDPRFLLPLCKQHHDIIHSVNQKYVRMKGV